MATREQELKAELLILTKLGQIEGRRKRALAHSELKHHEKYDGDRKKFLDSHPGLEAVLLKDGDSDHAAYLARVAAREKAAAEAAAKQPELSGMEASEEVSDAELVAE
jgi:hypothetical protein